MVPEGNDLVNEGEGVGTKGLDLGGEDKAIAEFERFEEEVGLESVMGGGGGDAMDVRALRGVGGRRGRLERESSPGGCVFAIGLFNHFIWASKGRGRRARGGARGRHNYYNEYEARNALG